MGDRREPIPLPTVFKYRLLARLMRFAKATPSSCGGLIPNLNKVGYLLFIYRVIVYLCVKFE